MEIKIETRAKSYYNDIYNFWIKNYKYWIPITDYNKLYIDTIIYNDFYKAHTHFIWKYSLITKEEKIGYIIFLDQFTRNMKRYKDLYYETDIISFRQMALKYCYEILKMPLDLNPYEIIICLFPFKHLGYHKYIFKYICANSNLLDNIIINKFYCDTYRKYYTEEKIMPKLHVGQGQQQYKPHELANVCEYYSRDVIPYKLPIIDTEITQLNRELLKNRELIKEKIIISLSGGVDSCVLTYLLSSLNKNIIVFHLIYNNRKESEKEFQLIAKYCNNLNIPLYYYRIKYFKRGQINREFYEKMTRNIRFWAYEKLGKNIILGHIKEDVIENIWTNFAKGIHLENLEGMKIKAIMGPTIIWRPFLYINKDIIISVAHKYGISYLLNTTPEWSNRGKFRNLYPLLKDIFNIDEAKTINMAQLFSHKDLIYGTILLDPIIKYYKTYSEFWIQETIIQLIDNIVWKYIFKITINKNISYKSINTLIQRIQEGMIQQRIKKNKFLIDIKIDLQLEFEKLYLKNEFSYFIKVKGT